MSAGTGSPAVRRASDLLTEIAAHPDGRTPAELSRRTRIPISSTYDLINDLVELDALSRHADGRVVLGDDLSTLARGFVNGSRLIDRFRSAAITSWELADITLLLTQLRDEEVLVLASHRGERTLPITVRGGMRWPTGATAAGIVLLTAFPGNAVEGLAERVSAARVSGYSIMERTEAMPLVSVAVPVPVEFPAAVCALLDEDRLAAQALLDPLQRFAERIA